MRFQQVCIESLGYVLPEEVLTSNDVEQRLEPLYKRLRLPSGRLELMTGIRERRFWAANTMPSDSSIQSCRPALRAADLAPSQIGALIHASVCRDHLEPATASRVHDELGLPYDCVIYDVSNACLGILNGMLQAANMIELGQIDAALVVGSEGSRALVETTIDSLNRDPSWTRRSVKLAVASLTIGSASVAVALTHESISQTQNQLLGGAVMANTEHHRLCHSGSDEAASTGMQPLMTTDSEKLMAEGIKTGAACFNRFKETLHWSQNDIDRSICHQVGTAHRKLMLESLNLRPETDFATLEYLGNTGSAALPTTLALGLEYGHVNKGDQLALLGIGSGINSVMLGVDWQQTLVEGTDPHRNRRLWQADTQVGTA